MARLLASTRVVVVSGTVENQGRFYDRFDHVVLLSAPLDVLIERVSKRTTNPCRYGNDPPQQAEIADYLETVEPWTATLSYTSNSTTARHVRSRPPHRGNLDARAPTRVAVTTSIR